MKAYQLVCADVLRQVPLLDAARLVAGDELALIGVYAEVVDWTKVGNRGPGPEQKYRGTHCHSCDGGACSWH